MLRIFGGIWQQVKLEQNIVIYFMVLVVNYIYIYYSILRNGYTLYCFPRFQLSKFVPSWSLDREP